MEDMELKFKEIAERYCSVKAEDITNDMNLRNDLGLSSLDLMTLLGDVEDELDIEFEFGDDDTPVVEAEAGPEYTVEVYPPQNAIQGFFICGYAHITRRRKCPFPHLTKIVLFLYFSSYDRGRYAFTGIYYAKKVVFYPTFFKPILYYSI